MIDPGSAEACALKTTDRSLWCWGVESPGATLIPTHFMAQGSLVTGIYALCDNNISDDYLDGTGKFFVYGSPSNQVACP